jgi:hypothetical protein
MLYSMKSSWSPSRKPAGHSANTSIFVSHKYPALIASLNFCRRHGSRLPLEGKAWPPQLSPDSIRNSWTSRPFPARNLADRKSLTFRIIRCFGSPRPLYQTRMFGFVALLLFIRLCNPSASPTSFGRTNAFVASHDTYQYLCLLIAKRATIA